MKRIFALLFLMVILSVIPSVFAEERAQTYSSFAKFVDNVRMLLSFGDKKVKVALEIRDKEVDSAVANTKNGDDEEAERNLERARKKLQFVQNKVSKDIAEDVKSDVAEALDRVKEKDLPDNFKTYVLEEEKTQLTAELVIQVEGKEGQNLSREMVKDGEGGENTVDVVVEVDNVSPEIMKIEMRIDEIDNIIEAGENIVEKGMDPVDTSTKTKDNKDVTPQKSNGDADDTFVGPDGPGPGVIDDD